MVDADVNYKIAKEFTQKVKQDAMGQKVLAAVDPGQLMVKIVQDRLTELMGGTVASFELPSKPSVILIAGLQGSGKTTFSAKLANYLKSKQTKKVLLVACDVYRPAAIKQLKILAEAINVEVFANEESKQPVEIAKNALTYANTHGHNVVIIDTAGRLAIDADMMNEISAIKEHAKPDQTLFVVDSMTGQDAVNTAKAFNERLDYEGVVLTKLDGDTRGGAALTIRYIVDKPIKFVSYGEKMETLDKFHPDRMAQRILGMGDIVSFVEKAQAQYDEKEAQRLQKKIRKNEFDFNDFLAQLNQIRKMGSLKDLLGMIPGMGKALKEVDVDDASFSKIEAMIFSMTPEERANPVIINGSRRKRIANGSGNTIQEVNQFIKQFDQMRKMLRTVGKFSNAGRSFKGLPFNK